MEKKLIISLILQSVTFVGINGTYNIIIYLGLCIIYFTNIIKLDLTA